MAPADLLRIVSRWKSASVRPPQAAELAHSERDILAAAAYRRYQDNLKRVGAVDFDDLLLHTEELLTKFPAVRRAEAGRFDHVLIDEYQDTNRSQYEIVRALAGGHRNLCVVGDDDQSIYGWRGAEVTHILRFKQDWPEAKVVRLEDNYRSTAAIIAYANTLIAFNRNRHDKVLKASQEGGTRPAILQCQDETIEAQRVVADIKQAIESKTARAAHIAILCRTNEQPRSFETELRRSDVPYVLIGGMSFFDRKEVRDVLSYLKVIDNPHDEPALMRIINQPVRGIGNAAQKRLVDEATDRGKFLWDVLPDALVIDGVDAKSAAAIAQFRHLIEDLRTSYEESDKADGRKKKSVAPLTSRVLDRTGYRDSLIKLYPDPADAKPASHRLKQSSTPPPTTTKHPRLRPQSGRVPRRHAPQPARRHRRKRLAALPQCRRADDAPQSAMFSNPGVYLVGMEEGILPRQTRVADESGTAIDEERRLCYVGVTRARDTSRSRSPSPAANGANHKKPSPAASSTK